MAGVSRLQYTNEIRLIRVMCSGRVDLEFILRAFAREQDGVFVGGCRLGECNYVTQGNYDALGNVLLCKKIMEQFGLNPERLRIQFMSSGDGMLLAEGIDDFTAKIRELGPIGAGEGLDLEGLKFKLEAARKLVPFIRLMERERLRVPVKSEAAYREFFAGEAVNRIFHELLDDKLAVSQIMMLLREKPLPTAEIAKKLGLNPSDVSRHMKSSSRQGLVRYDSAQNCYCCAMG
jgi:coenzyme F420-reducing hydrogenase delta subunit